MTTASGGAGMSETLATDQQPAASSSVDTADDIFISYSRADIAHAKALQKKERSGAKQRQPTPQITDQMIDAMLAREDFRGVFEQSLKAAGIDQPLDQMPDAERRNYARQFLEAMAEAQQASQQSSGSAGPSDAQLDKMLANPQVRAKLGEVLKANNIDTSLDDMPPEAQRNILRQVLAAQNKDQ